MSDFETTAINGVVYDVIKLRPYMEQVPTVELQLVDIQETIGEGHTYWEDSNGNPFGPFTLLQDWEAAQKNPLWQKHIVAINNADPDTHPIWIFRKENEPDFVFDGIHRLTKAFLEGRKTIQVKVVRELPEWARV